MSKPVDLAPAIAEAAAGPSKVISDGQEYDAQALADLMAADRYLAEKAALAGGRSAWGCLRPARAVLPSAVGPNTTGV